MNEIKRYPEAFRKQALERVYTRGSRTVKAVAEELNINAWTLKNWMKSHQAQLTTHSGATSKRPTDWSPAERLEILMASHGLDEQRLNALCRERGIFRHHLQQWRAAFEALPSGSSPVSASALKELKETNKALERELKRKDKALAEAAALLVLQKKYQALWEDKDG